MKNIIISFIIFFIVLGFVVFYNKNLISFCDETLIIGYELQTLIENEQWDESYEKALELKALISDAFKSMSIYVNHSEMDEMNIEILKLTEYIKEKDSAEGLATLQSIKCYAEYIKELQKVNLTNIL